MTCHKKIDYVLVYKKDTNENKEKRESYEKRLVNEGLQLELDMTHPSLFFLTIHAPDNVLLKYYEILKIKMRLKKNGNNEEVDKILNRKKSIFIRLLIYWDLYEYVIPNPKYFPEINNELRTEFNCNKSVFDMLNPNIFPESNRISIVYFIMEGFNDSKDGVCDVGIEQLINQGVYKAAYPLHDGETNTENSQRYKLLTKWAKLSELYKFQPIDYINDYYGAKIALYYLWLGYYCRMLILPSVFGTIWFFYGFFNYSHNSLTLFEDICNSNYNITMCPICDRDCDYWNLTEKCGIVTFISIFDNKFTIIFALIMSIWSTIYLGLWKRYSANVIHKWGLSNFDDNAEHPRYQYHEKIAYWKKKQKKIEKTNLLEDIVPFWKVRFPIKLLNLIVIIFLIIVASIIVALIIFYRMSLFLHVRFFESLTYRILFLNASGALIYMTVMYLLSWIYDKIAVRLTEFEYLRTQTEFDNSLAFKIYLFQFLNCYSFVFYIIFYKGKFIGNPMKYNRIFGYRQEECTPGNCFFDLCIQVAMVIVMPRIFALLKFILSKCLRHRQVCDRVKNILFFSLKYKIDNSNKNQWLSDYKLLQWRPRTLFDKYWNIVLQYGSITMFAFAFTLGPLFALIINLIEIRRSSAKFLRDYQRPVPQRVKNIGSWFDIMDIISKMSPIINASMIAFTSSFIPQLVYNYDLRNGGSDKSFLETSLAYFNVTDFQEGKAPINSSYTNITMCRYAEYRYPPQHIHKYDHSDIYWKILAVRLGFILLFQIFVYIFRKAIEWLIDELSFKLPDYIKRETYLINKIYLNYKNKEV